MPERPSTPVTRCPECDSEEVLVLPNDPKSLIDWFQCEACDHMWAVQRDKP